MRPAGSVPGWWGRRFRFNRLSRPAGPSPAAYGFGAVRLTKPTPGHASLRPRQISAKTKGSIRGWTPRPRIAVRSRTADRDQCAGSHNKRKTPQQKKRKFIPREKRKTVRHKKRNLVRHKKRKLVSHNTAPRTLHMAAPQERLASALETHSRPKVVRRSVQMISSAPSANCWSRTASCRKS